MKAIIYEIITPDKERYIGSTINSLEVRMRGHIRLFRKGTHHSKELQRIVRDLEVITANIIEEFEYIDIKEIYEKEQYYINILKPKYNIQRIVRKNGLSTTARNITGMNIYTEEIYNFKSISEAERTLNISGISGHLKNRNILKKCKNYVFKDISDNTITLEQLARIALKPTIRKKVTLKYSPNRGEAIIMIIKGRQSRVFNSITECSIITTIPIVSIHRCLKSGKYYKELCKFKYKPK